MMAGEGGKRQMHSVLRRISRKRAPIMDPADLVDPRRISLLIVRPDFRIRVLWVRGFPNPHACMCACCGIANPCVSLYVGLQIRCDVLPY